MASKPPSLKELLRGVPKKTLKKPCSDEHIVEIAREITNWQSIALCLGLTAVDEENILQNYRDVQTQRIKMMRIWKQTFGSKATYGSLAKALHKDKRVDLVEKVVELLTEKPAATSSLKIRPPQRKKAANSERNRRTSGSARKRRQPQHQLLTEDAATASSHPPPPKKAALGLHSGALPIPQEGGATSKPAPLRFWQCGASVQVAEGGMQVMKKHILAAMRSFGVALTNRPLRTEELFQIEILNHRYTTDPPIGMAFGITTHSPDEIMDFPRHMRELKIGTWMLDWNWYRHNKSQEHVVAVDGEDVKQDFVSGDDLRALKPATFKYAQVGRSLRALMSALIPVKDEPGDRVALRVTEKRELVFYINGVKKGVVGSDIPEGVYGFVELPGESTVELVLDDTHSVPGQ